MAKVANKVVDVENMVVQFSFTDGRVLELPLGNLSTEMIDRLALHGIAQKIGDSYAGAETLDEAFAAASTVVANLEAGIWATKSSRGGIWVEAIQRAAGCEFEEAFEKWSKADDATKKELRNHPQVKLAKAEIEQERAAKMADSLKDAEPLDLSTL